MNVNIVQNDTNHMYSNSSYQTINKQDVVSNEYMIKIAKTQEQLKNIAKDDDKSIEEKQDMQRELRQQIQELNRQLRNHKKELQKEEKKNKELAEQSKIEQQKSNLGEDNRLNTEKNEGTIKATISKEDSNQNEKEKQLLGTIKSIIVAENSKEIVAKQSKTHVRLKGEGKVLESEIKIDKQRENNSKKKEERLENIELRIDKVSKSIQKQLNDTVNIINTKTNTKQENNQINYKFGK